jgi:ornithine cyclodeaminase
MEFINAEKVRNLLSMKETVQAVEEFYQEDTEDKIVSPERMHIEDDGNTSLIMPSYFGEYYATKLVGVAPGNTKLGKPTIHGIMALYNRRTMEPLLLCDAVPVTESRTGAIGGLGMKYLGKEKAVTLGIVGTGTQGWSHLQSAITVRSIEKVYIYNRTEEKADKFIEKAQKEYPYIHIEKTTPEFLVKLSDIIVTCTTSTTPVLPELPAEAWKGKLIVGVGSFRPAMQEIPDSVLKQADEIHVDAGGAFRESGDMLKAKDLGRKPEDSMSLKEIIGNSYKPDNTEEKLIIFKSVGDAVFDLVGVKALYEKLDDSAGMESSLSAND